MDRVLKELARDLAEFEQRYHINSDDFYQGFKEGRLGDAMDFVEWTSLFQMFQRIKARKEKLERGAQECEIRGFSCYGCYEFERSPYHEH